MKITAARVIVCSPGRNFVTLKIETDQGVYGVGDATLNGILEKNGDELHLMVSDDASTEVQSPQNHAFHIGIKPQPSAQTLTIATGFSANVVKGWGLTVG